MDVRRLILLLLLLGSSCLAHAEDMRPPELKITLERLPVLQQQSDIIPLRINIRNVSSHAGSILVPFAQNFGKSLFQLRIYEIDQAGKYKLIFTSQDILDMDTSKYKTEGGFWHLDSGESYSLPLFINDSKNARKRFESSIQIPDLKSGKYAFQVLYTPENSSFFKYAFREFMDTDPIPEDDVDEYPDHFNWEGSVASNFLEYPFEILPKQHVLNPKSSVLCNAIYNENWKKVKRLWSKNASDKPCACILWKFDFHQAVLSSLPAYTGFDAIFYTKSGIKYATFTYQLGKVHRLRSRMAWLFHAVGFRRAPIKTSKVNWSKLIGVNVWE